ncbi:MAG: hypothetical protein LBV78_26445 [Kitasatospora sp.]|nr:hypothetical protein [Kitasatospora sp.]
MGARADGTFTTAEPEPATVAPAGPASENDMINQLAGVLLGGAPTPDGTGTDGTPDTDSTPDTDRTSGGSPAADPTTARTDTAASTRTDTQAGTRTDTPADTADRADDAAYLERSRSAAARRGHPDAPAATAAPAPATAAPAPAAEGAAAAPQRAPLREEGGFQVPSPFLRAALSRLAAPAAD